MATDLSGAAASGILGATMGMLIFMTILSIAVYIYVAITWMIIAKKTDTPNGWLAFIPIANIYLLTQMAGVSGLWTLILLAGFIPFVGQIAVAAVMIWMFWLMAERIDFPGWTSLLLLVPILNLIMFGVWAWSKK